MIAKSATVPWVKGAIRERITAHETYFNTNFGWYVNDHGNSLAKKHVPYQDLQQLNDVQGLGAKLSYHSMTAQTIINNLINYIVGKGHTYKVSLRKGKSADDGTRDRYQAAVDRFTEKVNWPVFQEDFYTRWYRTGEVLQHIDAESRTLDVTWAEPHDLRGKDEAKYGIQYEKDRFGNPRVDRPSKFYFRNQEGEAKPIDAKHIMHCKRGVDLNDPRGIPLLWNTYVECREIDELQWALSQVMLAAAENSVVWEYPSGQNNQRTIDMVTTALDDHNKQLADAGQTSDPGRHTVADGFEVKNYGAQIAATQWIEAIASKERRIGAVASLPEFIMTGDADTGSRNSLFAAEGPMLRSVDREAEKGSKCEIKLLARVIAASEDKFDDDEFEQDFHENFVITAKVPLPSTETEADRSSRLLAEVEAGLLDPPGFCEKMNRDYEAVMQGIQQHNERARESAGLVGPDAYHRQQIDAIMKMASQLQSLGLDPIPHLEAAGFDPVAQREMLEANGIETRTAA